MATKKSATFSDADKAAMKETASDAQRVKSLKGAAKAEAEAAICLEKIAEMGDADRVIAEGVHEIITKAAPELAVKTWYGMPAYAKDGKVVAFFQPGEKFKARYCTLGFNDAAALDDGSMWATSFAITQLTPAVKKQLVELVKRAVA